LGICKDLIGPVRKYLEESAGYGVNYYTLNENPGVPSSARYMHKTIEAKLAIVQHTGEFNFFARLAEVVGSYFNAHDYWVVTGNIGAWEASERY
jgi:hypothetical protein